MRVLLLCRDRDDGEMATHVLRFGRSLARREHRVAIAGPAESWLARQCRASTVACHEIPMRGPVDLRSYARILGLVRRLGIEVVHGHGERSARFAAVVGRLAGRPAIATTRTPERPGIVGLTHRIVGRSTGRRSVVSNGDARERGRAKPFDRNRRCSVARSRLGLGPGDVALAIAGPLEGRAGHGLLIDAIAKIREVRPTVHLFVVGGDDARHAASLAQRVLDRGLTRNVRFHEEPELPVVLSAMDLFVLPGPREGAYLSVIEAFGAGLPVVASIGSGIADHVRHGETGMLFARGDGSMLAAMLALLIEDPDWREGLGANARRLYVERFALQGVVDETETIYRRC